MVWNIYINWEKILKNTKIQIISTLIILSITMYSLYNYTSLFNGIKYQFATYYTIKLLEKDAEKVLEEEKENLLVAHNKKIEDLEKKLEQDKKDLDSKYNKLLINLRNKIDSEYKMWFTIKKENYNLLNLTALSFNNDFSELMNTNNSENINDFSIIEKIDDSYKQNRDLMDLYDNDNIIEKKEDTKDIKKDVNNVKDKIVEIKKEEKKVSAVNFSYDIKWTDWNINFLRKSNLEPILPYGITFPSLFSYKLNGVKVLPWYYDIHYGVDYKTKPDVYFDFYYFKDKKWEVLISDYSEYGNKLVIWNKDSWERFEYLHLDKMYVNVWDKINAEQKIAKTWISWKITWPHLHFVYFKDWFFVPYDWGLDVDNKHVLKQFNDKLSEAELNEFINQWKKDYINMEYVFLLYNQTITKDINNIKKIKEVIRKNELENKYKITDFINDADIKWLFDFSNWKNAIVNKLIKDGDKLHQIKKTLIIDYLEQNKNKVDDFITFNKSKLWPVFNVDNKHLVKWKVDFKECNDYQSWIFNFYQKVIVNNDISYIGSKQIDNINYMTPLILEQIDKNNIVWSLNEKFSDVEFNKCDILFLELWKRY